MPAHADIARRHRAAVVTWLAHPVTVFALALLAVNDHVLKAAYPGPVTGKLSDLAGLVVAPPVLATVAVFSTRRLSAAVAAYGAITVVGAGFAVTKAYPAAAVAASGLWSLVRGRSVILADRSDLAVLPILALAAWLAMRARRRPDPGRAWRLRSDLGRRLSILVVLPAAALAIAATGAVYYPSAVTVVPWRSGIAVGVAYTFQKPGAGASAWRASEDGATWRDLTPAEQLEFTSAARPPATAQCAPAPASRECYRVVPGHLRVEQSGDGGATWSVSWEIKDQRRQVLAYHYPEMANVSTDLASQALVVSARPGGYVVVVANGRDGLAVRDVRGQWRRTSMEPPKDPSYDPPQPVDKTPASLVLAAVLAAVLAGCATVGIALTGATPLRKASLVVFGTILALTASLGLIAVLGLYSHDGLLQWTAGALAIGSTLATAVGTLGIVSSVLYAGAVRGRLVAWAMATALIITVAIVVLSLSVPWLTGRPFPVFAAVLAAIIGVAIAARARRKAPLPGSLSPSDRPEPASR